MQIHLFEVVTFKLNFAAIAVDSAIGSNSNSSVGRSSSRSSRTSSILFSFWNGGRRNQFFVGCYNGSKHGDRIMLCVSNFKLRLDQIHCLWLKVVDG